MTYLIVSWFLMAQTPLVVPASWLQLLKDWGSAGAVIVVVWLFLRQIKVITDSLERKLTEINERHIESNEVMFNKLESIDNRSVDVLVKIAETISEHNNSIRGHNEAIIGLKNELQEIRLTSSLKQNNKMLETH